MSDEAEEFRKQQERFKALKKMFDDKFKPGINYQLTSHYEDRRIFSDKESYTAKFTIDKTGFPKNDNERYYDSAASALRALNDRLELALQGKVKGNE